LYKTRIHCIERGKCENRVNVAERALTTHFGVGVAESIMEGTPGSRALIGIKLVFLNLEKAFSMALFVWLVEIV